MCEIDEKSFVYELFKEIKKKIKLKKEFGEIQFGQIPPRIQSPSEHIIRAAIATTFVKTKQSYSIEFSESIIMDGPSMKPSAVAAIIIQMAMQLTKKIPGLKPAREPLEFGRKKIYWDILDAVLSLFLDKLAEVESNKHFEEKMDSVNRFVRLLSTKFPGEAKPI